MLILESLLQALERTLRSRTLVAPNISHLVRSFDDQRERPHFLQTGGGWLDINLGGKLQDTNGTSLLSERVHYGCAYLVVTGPVRRKIVASRPRIFVVNGLPERRSRRAHHPDRFVFPLNAYALCDA